MNRDRNVEWLPILGKYWKRKRLGYILMNLCAQYALSSRVNAWDGADYELIEITLNCLCRSLMKRERQQMTWRDILPPTIFF